MLRPGDTLILRPEVQVFAQAMEATLRDNDYKGGWKDMTPKESIRRLYQESGELWHEIKDYPGRINTIKTLREACDVANYAMFTADVAGALQYE